ncbi:hypothetical protein H1R20_g13937, partial [Candolleomyces eurysporus]
MAFLSLLRPGFLKLRRGKDSGNPLGGDKQPAPCSLHILKHAKNVRIDKIIVNNVAGNLNQVVYSSAESREAELLRTNQVVQRKLPQAVGFSNTNALIITDALGETFTLPWSIVATYEDLHDTLAKHFRGKVAHLLYSLNNQ